MLYFVLPLRQFSSLSFPRSNCSAPWGKTPDCETRVTFLPGWACVGHFGPGAHALICMNTLQLWLRHCLRFWLVYIANFDVGISVSAVRVDNQTRRATDDCININAFVPRKFYVLHWPDDQVCGDSFMYTRWSPRFYGLIGCPWMRGLACQSARRNGPGDATQYGGCAI